MRRTAHVTRLLLAASAAACVDTSTNAPTSPDDRTPIRETAVAGGKPDDRANSALSGGETTVFDDSPDAFSHPAPNLNAKELEQHDEGDEAFEAAFVPDPTAENGGLGPVFDNVSCEACHIGDGRGRPPLPGEVFATMLFRASVTGKGPHGGPKPAPGFGGQLQLRAIDGLVPEVEAAVTYTDSLGSFADGSTFRLRVPRYSFRNSYVPLPAKLLVSPRVAPVVFGLGLLEAVPEPIVRALADPGDRDGDGVSGRANNVWDEVEGGYALGRFGWKASVPSLFQQTAGAYNGDMGVTSSVFPAEACEGDRPQCTRHAAEVDDEIIEAAAFYTQTLGVPARRNLNDPKARQGEVLFHAVGCARCHTSTLVTGVLPGVPAVSRQVIHPYTDLLLHDMGAALADDRPDFLASGREWRTPPLWGIGLVQVVNGHTNFLHDGRARSLLEAVLWHGGEAERAREAVRRLSAKERAALIAFLESL